MFINYVVHIQVWLIAINVQIHKHAQIVLAVKSLLNLL